MTAMTPLALLEAVALACAWPLPAIVQPTAPATVDPATANGWEPPPAAAPNTTAAANGWEPEPTPQPEPAPAPVASTPSPPAPADAPVDAKPRLNPAYRSASALLKAGIGVTAGGAAVLLLLTWPAYGLKQRSLRYARGADDLYDEREYLDRAYHRNRFMWVSGVIGASMMATGVVFMIAGGTHRAVLRASDRMVLEPTPDGLAIRF